MKGVLYYYGARYYAGWIGRFCSVDPQKEQRSWVNPYNYVQNNPINRTDPTGALDDDPPEKSTIKPKVTATESQSVDKVDMDTNTFKHKGTIQDYEVNEGQSAKEGELIHSRRIEFDLKINEDGNYDIKGYYSGVRFEDGKLTKAYKHPISLQNISDLSDPDQINPELGQYIQDVLDKNRSKNNSNDSNTGGVAGEISLAATIGEPIGKGSEKILKNRGSYLPKDQIYKTNKPVAVKTPARININTTSRILNYARIGGKALGIAGILSTGYQTFEDVQNNKIISATARAAVWGLAVAATSIPVFGWGIALTIGILDYCFGDKFYNWLERIFD